MSVKRNKGFLLTTGYCLLATVVLFSILSISAFCQEKSIESRVKEINIPFFHSQGKKYIAVSDLVRIFPEKVDWGRVDERFFLSYRGHILNFQIESKEYLLDGELKMLPFPVKYIEGMVALPFDPIVKVLQSLPPPPPSLEEILAQKEKPEKEEPISIPSLEEVISEKKKGEWLILIDAGHGGKDSGAIGEYGLKEKDVNLDISLRLENYLKKKNDLNLKIVLTRRKDIFIPLEGRVKMANESGADIFFCIHTNSARYNRWTVDGFETFYPSSKSEVLAAAPLDSEGLLPENSDSLSEIIADGQMRTNIERSKYLASLVQEELTRRLITPNRGVKAKSFYVLKYTKMPSILVEIGFICNPNIEANLRDPYVRQVMAESLGKSIIAYTKNRPLEQRTDIRP